MLVSTQFSPQCSRSVSTIPDIILRVDKLDISRSTQAQSQTGYTL